MWMMGYNDGGELNMPDSCNSRKLRPLIPRPMPSANNNDSTSNPSCLSRLPGSDFFALNHNLAAMTDQSKREFNAQPVVVSSRWNPTPEQLRTLEELYRRGTRTPTADQIQQITAQLRRYGKIEGKNVFYWFQNHKARERQKRRRQVDYPPDEPSGRDIEILERKESGANRTGYECEQTKNWVPSTNCSTLSEESCSIHRAAKAALSECRPDGWMQFDEGELQHRRGFMERNGTWQMMQLSCPSLPSHHHINTGISTTSTTASPLPTTSVATSTTTLATMMRTMDPKLIKTTHDLSIFITPYIENGHGGLLNHFNNTGAINEEHCNCGGESQTLQLFPLRDAAGGGGGDGNESINEKETEISVTPTMNASNFTPYQFFEFLPLKN